MIMCWVWWWRDRRLVVCTNSSVKAVLPVWEAFMNYVANTAQLLTVVSVKTKVQNMYHHIAKKHASKRSRN